MLHLALPDRSTAELRLAADAAAELVPHVSGAPAPALPPEGTAPLVRASPPPVPRGWGAIVCLTLGVLWMTAMLLPAVTGYAATATVLGGDGEGFCDVTWQTEDGTTLEGESDCYDEPEGTTFPVWVSGWPFAPEPATPETVLSLTLIVGLPFTGGAALRLAQLRFLRRAPASEPFPVPPPPPPHPDTGRAAPREGSALSDEATATAVTRSLRRAWAVVCLGAVSVCALIVLDRVGTSLDAEFMAASARTSGTILELQLDARWDRGSASVRFTAGSATTVRSVVLGSLVDDYAEGEDVTVFYDPADPDRVTIDDVMYEPAWVGWLMVPAFGGTLCLPYGAWLVVQNRRMRRLLRDRPWGLVGVQVFHGDRCCWFTTSDGAVWRSEVDGDASWMSAGGNFWNPWLEADADETAWWVANGNLAVFSPDGGPTLVRARRRSRLPRKIGRAVTKELATMD